MIIHQTTGQTSARKDASIFNTENTGLILKGEAEGKKAFILNKILLVAILAADILLLERRELCFYYYPNLLLLGCF